MRHTRSLVFAALSVAGAAGVASADLWFFSVNLDGAQEVPPVPTAGLGTAAVTLDDATGHVMLTSGSFSGLGSNATAAHIHGLAPVGVNAGVLIPLAVPTATSGTITGVGTLTPAQVTGMLNNQTYINVHSLQFPGGEIRGQILLIPAPGALAMLGVGGFLAFRRRR